MKENVKRFYTILIVLVVASCSPEKTHSQYLRWVGDSTFDPEVDEQSFELCHGENRVKQYFNFSQGLKYQGEKSDFVKYFLSNYTPGDATQSGWIRIRFIVNCKGETGRFRVMGADPDYQPQEFDSSITDQLRSLTQSLEGWALLPDKEKPQDYYQYLIFKMKDGNIEEILP